MARKIRPHTRFNNRINKMKLSKKDIDLIVTLLEYKLDDIVDHYYGDGLGFLGYDFSKYNEVENLIIKLTKHER